MKVEPVLYGDRKVYTVSAFNRGISRFLGRLPAVWVEGEVTELRRNSAWATVFLTLKDPKTGASLKVTIARSTYDRLELGLAEGETVHAAGRAELYELKGELGLRASTLERIGVGGHLVALERLKRELAAEGLFAPERKRRLPRVPRAIGVLTGADAAARGDLLTTIGRRFPPTKAIVCETRVQGRGAPEAIVKGLRALAAHSEVDVVVLTRGGGSFEDLLPFSTEAVVRAVATCAVPVVSAVGHEQDTPLCDLAADARAATPTAAAALVVPDVHELHASRDVPPPARPIDPQPARARRGADRASERSPAGCSAPPARAPACRCRSQRRQAPRALAPCDARPRVRGRTGGRGCVAGGIVRVGRGPARDRARRRPARGARRGRASVNEAASFESLQKELEDVVARLERGDVAVDDAIALFRRGEELYRTCVERLGAAELRIEGLTSSDGQTP